MKLLYITKYTKPNFFYQYSYDFSNTVDRILIQNIEGFFVDVAFSGEQTVDRKASPSKFS